MRVFALCASTTTLARTLFCFLAIAICLPEQFQSNSVMKLYEFLSFIQSESSLINFLCDRGVILNSIICPNCGNELIVNPETLMFRCRKRYELKQGKHKKIQKQCNFKRSVKVNTWLHNVSLPLESVCRFIAYFLTIRPPRFAFLKEELDFALATIVDWSSFCRGVCLLWAENQKLPLGGNGVIVEIDEAKIGKRKYNRGRYLKGKWIFGAFERGTKKIFVVPVENRSAKTLLKIIKERILPGTIVMSDLWRAYNCLKSEGFVHLTVNHSMNFVDPDTAMIGCRHIQAIMMTLGFFCCYAVRAALSMSLVAMTNAKSANPNFKEFDWDDSIQDLILSSFFWGYVATHIPGGLISQRWGVHRLYTWAMMVCGASTILIPIAADYGDWVGVCVCRVISGACQGIVPPVLHTLLSKWVPTEERARFGSFTYTGGWIGNVAALLSCGIISGSPLGWPSCFYIWGSLTIAWSTAWFLLGKESPADHPNIPDDEKEYIEVSLGVTETSEVLSTPWLALLSSGPLWALLIAQCTQAWGFWMLLTKTPMYMDKVLGYPITENGLLSAFPYFTAWILSFPVSYTADLLIKKKITSVNTSRKACNSLGELLPAIALIGLGFIDKDRPLVAVGVLTISVSTNVAIFCGHQVNHMDLSPNYSGTLMGITNAAANFCSILAPIVAGAIIDDKTDVTQWRKVFILSAIIYMTGSIVFVLFGSTVVQPWNESTSPMKSDLRVTMSKIPEDPSSEKTMNEKNDIITSDNNIARVSSEFFNPLYAS